MTPSKEKIDRDSATHVVHLHIWSCSHDESALEILNTISPPIVGPGYSGRCVIWGECRKRSHSFRDSRSLISKLSGQTFNDAQITVKHGASPVVLQSGVQLFKVLGQLNVSTTSSIWSPVDGYKCPKRVDEQRRMSYSSKESSRRFNRIARAPTILDLEMHVGIDQIAARLEETIAGIVSQLMENVPADLVGGYCDWFPRSATWYHTELSQLAPWPKAYDQLDERFVGLHPILIGPRDRAQRLANAVGISPRQVLQTNATTLDVVYLLEADLERARSMGELSELLVARDATTAARTLGDLPGAESVLGSWVFTEQRYRQLIDEGVYPPLEGQDVLWHILAPKYCRLLGIDPEQMYVTRGSKLLVDRLATFVDSAFEELDQSMPIVQRVLEAHRVGLERPRRLPYLEFVQRKFNLSAD